MREKPALHEIHRARVMEKMEATSLAQLVRMVLEAGKEVRERISLGTVVT